VRFTTTVLGLIKRGPTVVEAAHVGDPTFQDPKRTLAPDITKENISMYNEAIGKPAAPAGAAKPTGANEPPRSDQPSDVPVQTGNSEGTGVGATIVSAPNSAAATSDNTNPATIGSGPANAADPNALVKPITPETSAIPAAEAPAKAPDQVNDIKPGQQEPAPATAQNSKQKKPKADLGEESTSKKKKKKGLGKLNPF
jgi:outer membrane protein assembly factor BamD